VPLYGVQEVIHKRPFHKKLPSITSPPKKKFKTLKKLDKFKQRAKKRKERGREPPKILEKSVSLHRESANPSFYLSSQANLKKGRQDSIGSTNHQSVVKHKHSESMLEIGDSPR
jgi:hypothetical protein